MGTRDTVFREILLKFDVRVRDKVPFSNTLSDKTKSDKILVGHNYKSDKILVTSKNFGHFCPTNNLVHFEISILRESD